MTSRSLRILFCVVFVLVLTTSCAGTRLTRTYVNKNFTGDSASNILVIGVADKDRNRRLFERRFVAQLRAVGVKAVASGDKLPMPADLKLNKNDIIDAVQQFGNDAVIITHVIGIETDETITPHDDLSNDLYSYYGASYNDHHDAGHSRTTTKVYLETSLFDVQTEDLIWTGISKTWNRDSTRQIIDEVIGVVIKDLHKNRLIAPE